MGIIVKPLGRTACSLDRKFDPLMRVLCGTCYESPQRTHRWNNHHLKISDAEYLNREMMVCHNGIPGETAIYPLFHMPIFGGWRNYVVISPVRKQGEWYVGWISGNFVGVSRIPLSGLVRVLEGPVPVCWFGITATGHQIPLQEIVKGRIGEGGPYAQIPLL